MGKFQTDRRFNIIIWSITAFDIRDLRRFTANHVLIHHSFDSVSTADDDGTEVVSKRIKVIKIADKSDFVWSTVNEYLSDELASNSDDEKRMYSAERRAERKTKERRRRFRPAD